MIVELKAMDIAVPWYMEDYVTDTILVLLFLIIIGSSFAMVDLNGQWPNPKMTPWNILRLLVFIPPNKWNIFKNLKSWDFMY